MKHRLLDNHEIKLPQFWIRNCSLTRKIAVAQDAISAKITLCIERIVEYPPFPFSPIEHSQIGSMFATAHVDKLEVLTWEAPRVGESRSADVTKLVCDGMPHEFYACIGLHREMLGAPLPINVVSVWVTLMLVLDVEPKRSV